MSPVNQMTTAEIEDELNRLGMAGQWGERMEALEAELRERFGVVEAAQAVALVGDTSLRNPSAANASATRRHCRHYRTR